MVINLVSMLGGEASLVRIHKLLFLYSFKAVSPSYDFIPHKYGCYSFVLHDDIDAMVADGTLVRLGEESDSVFDSRIRQNWNGKVPEKMVLKHADAIPLATIARNFGKMSDEELIDFTYHVRPFYCINSQMLDRFSTDSELLSRIDRQRDKALSAERGLYTIGYEGLSLDKFLKKLICNNIKYLIDVRKNPFSMRREFRKESLINVLHKVGIEYVPMPEVGIPSANRNDLIPSGRCDELFQWYRSSIIPGCFDSARRVDSIVASGNAVLLCFEANPEECHRLIFANYCLEQFQSIGKIINIEERPVAKKNPDNCINLSLPF